MFLTWTRLADGVRNERITYHNATRLYACEAEGQPQPDYAWLVAYDNGTRQVVTTDTQLNVTQFRQDANVTLTFRCLASNIVDNKRYTKAVETTVFITG